MNGCVMKTSLTCLLAVLLFGTCEIKSKKDDMISQLQKVAKISTTEVVIEKVVYHRDDASGLLKAFAQDAYFVASTEARVKIGIDLSKIDPEKDVTIRGNSIAIQLPPLEITNFSYPAEKFEVNETISNARRAFLNKADLDDIEGYYRKAQTQIRETLPKTGVFETAETKTILVFTKMLQNLGYSVVQVSFKDDINPLDL